MGVTDHLEQAHRLGLTIDGPAGVEDLVPAVLGVGLREHQQLDIGRIAAEVRVTIGQIGDLIIAQGQTETEVGRTERCERVITEVHPAHGSGRGLHKERLGLHEIADRHRHHRVTDRPCQSICIARDPQCHTALDPPDGIDATHPENLCGLGRPRRDGANARDHHPVWRSAHGGGLDLKQGAQAAGVLIAQA